MLFLVPTTIPEFIQLIEFFTLQLSIAKCHGVHTAQLLNILENL